MRHADQITSRTELSFQRAQSSPEEGSLIMVVDDDKMRRHVLADALRGEGYDVCEESGASEAFSRVVDGRDGAARPVDLVITSLADDAGSLELVAALRGIEAPLSVVVMTRHLSSDQRELARLFDVDVVLGWDEEVAEHLRTAAHISNLQ